MVNCSGDLNRSWEWPFKMTDWRRGSMNQQHLHGYKQNALGRYVFSKHWIDHFPFSRDMHHTITRRKNLKKRWKQNKEVEGTGEEPKKSPLCLIHHATRENDYHTVSALIVHSVNSIFISLSSFPPENTRAWECQTSLWTSTGFKGGETGDATILAQPIMCRRISKRTTDQKS